MLGPSSLLSSTFPGVCCLLCCLLELPYCIVAIFLHFWNFRHNKGSEFRILFLLNLFLMKRNHQNLANLMKMCTKEDGWMWLAQGQKSYVLNHWQMSKFRLVSGSRTHIHSFYWLLARHFFIEWHLLANLYLFTNEHRRLNIKYLLSK